MNALRGWGGGLRNAVGRWYLEQEADKLAYGADRVATYAPAGELPEIIEAFEKAKKAPEKS